MRGALFVILLLAGAGVAAYGYYRSNEIPAGSGSTYTTENLTRGDVVATVTATGTLEPVIKVVVGSQVSGTVVKYYADFNDEVKAGDVLLELDKDRLEAMIAQRSAAVAVAEARVEESQAALDQAALDQERIDEAAKQFASSRFEQDAARLGVQAARAQLRAAQANVEAAKADLENSRSEFDKSIIRAPIDGIVISRDIDIGQTVAASFQTPALYTIANDLRNIRVNVAVSESDVGRIKAGMATKFRVDAYPERMFHGRVTQVRYAETVVDNVVTYETLIEVRNEDLALRPGMTATVMFQTQVAEGVLRVPNAALRFNPDDNPADLNWSPGKGVRTPRVFTLADGGLRQIDLKLGVTDGRFTAAEADGLKEDMPLVIGWSVKSVDQSKSRFRMW
ncbi:MAG: efflux RND transporter periplasmic adaptor subunit [Phycisphaerales bacterium]|nr:efflux RND transporter periplasmic adaptor subunit [Phycisphaerales bacterium]